VFVPATAAAYRVVDQLPTLGLDQPGTKGIDVTAGLLNATGNQVQQVR
jgi:hypothetical protein